MRKVREINRGGFGVVHEVEMPNGGRRARKSFAPQGKTTPEEEEKLKRRFAREVKVQSQIRHPNIMPILSHNLEASPPWFTMPLAQKSFRDKLFLPIQESRSLTPRERERSEGIVIQHTVSFR